MAIENQNEEAAPKVILDAAPEGDEAPVVENTDSVQVSNTVEDRARDQGWRPKEEWEGDPSKWVSAETFVAKGELIDKIESLGKKLKDADKTIKMLTEHHHKVKESEFKRAVDFLKSQKKSAYEQGDVDKIIELDDKIAEVRDIQKAQKAQEEVKEDPQTHPDFISWVSDNKWYEKNSEMRSDADVIGEAYARNNPDKTPTEVLEHVTKKIRKMYAEEFQNQNRTRPSAVEGSGRQAQSNSGITLTEEERHVMNTFIRQGIMTKEEYISEIKKVKGAA